MDSFYKFPCGCKLKIIGNPVNNSGLPLLDIDYYNIDMNCPAAWKVFCDGHTQGIFQVESQLGRNWCREIGPNNEEEVSAISALMRPGCLESFQDGKNMTQHYADRKNNKELVKEYHPVVDRILKDTYGVLTYQEQSMKLAQEIAGFSEQEADMLRKAIGKKKPEEMAKVKKQFLEKSKELNIVTEKQAEEIFDWIEKSQRYQFNKSHSISYAYLSYYTAYAKAHGIVYFLTSWLSLAQEKLDPHKEVELLVGDASLFDVPVKVAKFCDLKTNFYTDGKSITCGIGNIKNVGSSVINKIQSIIPLVEALLNKRIEDFSWYDILFFVSSDINSKSFQNLIYAGAFSYFGISRNKMVYEYGKWSELTENEQLFIKNKHLLNRYTSLITAMEDACKTKKNGGACHSEPRTKKLLNTIQLLKNPPLTLTDSPDKVAFDEKQLIGASLTYSKIDGCDIGEANSTCKELLQGKFGKYIVIACEILRVKETTIKKEGENKGKKMAFLAVTDTGCVLDNITIFSSEYQQFKHFLVVGNTVLIRLEKGNKGGFIAKVIQQC